MDIIKGDSTTQYSMLYKYVALLKKQSGMNNIEEKCKC